MSSQPKNNDWNNYLAILQVLNNYAEACDRRNWALFESVFCENVDARYGDHDFPGREAVIKIIRNSLGGCGPTIHQLSNYYVDIDGNNASTRCYVRASHYGLGEKSGQFYEVWGGIL